MVPEIKKFVGSKYLPLTKLGGTHRVTERRQTIILACSSVHLRLYVIPQSRLVNAVTEG